jgi:1,2-diacylglycerol 3-alpha-glucosyltransferase
MKVAMMVDSHHPVKDGVVDAIDLLRKGLEERGHEVLLIAPDPGKKNRLDGVHYIPAVSFGAFGGYYLPIFPSDSIFKLKEMDIDVINIHGFAFMAVRGITSGRLLNKPVVVTFHTPVWDFIGDYSPLDPELSLRVSWSYFRRMFRRADVTVAQTPSVAKELTDNGVVSDIRVIPTGIDTERFRPGSDGLTIRKRYGIEGKKAVIHVGRLSPEKCLDVLINAFTELDEDTVLMIVGKGALEKELKELTSALGLAGRVIFTGFVSEEELPMHYAAADAAASSSIYEAQCLAIMNAMASGLPVACPKGKAFVDFIEDGVNGFMYDHSSGGCAEAIRRCLSADAQIGANARRTAEEYSIPRSMDAYISLYEEAIKKRRRG